MTVQQHKSFRSVNHEIFIQITLEKAFNSTVDWEIRLMQGIVEALEDDSLASIVVRNGEQINDSQVIDSWLRNFLH